MTIARAEQDIKTPPTNPTKPKTEKLINNETFSYTYKLIINIIWHHKHF